MGKNRRKMSPGSVLCDALLYLRGLYPDAVKPQPHTMRGMEVRSAVRILESLMCVCDQTWNGEWVELEPRDTKGENVGRSPANRS